MKKPAQNTLSPLASIPPRQSPSSPVYTTALCVGALLTGRCLERRRWLILPCNGGAAVAVAVMLRVPCACVGGASSSVSIRAMSSTGRPAESPGEDDGKWQGSALVCPRRPLVVRGIVTTAMLAGRWVSQEGTSVCWSERKSEEKVVL